VGGNSRRAIRRAVELADGWMPFPAPPRLAGAIRTAAITGLSELGERLAFAREHARAVGRSAPLDVCFVPFGFDFAAAARPEPEAFRAQVVELGALGVTWLALNLPCDSRAEYEERVAELGARFLPRRAA
jgi:hypothetical protein